MKIQSTVKLLGIPFDANSSFLRGCSSGPDAIRLIHEQGASNAYTEGGKLLEMGRNLLDLGDLHFASDAAPTAHKLICDEIQKHISDGSKLISLGGDHSITFPIIKAFHKFFSELHILHFDAHGDLYHDFQNNYYSHASPFARIMENGLATSITQVGIRTLTHHQREQAEKFQLNIIEMKDFDFHFLDELQAPLYISFDIDVLDPAFAPGVSHHEPGGLSVRTAIKCLQSLNVNIVGADIVEYNQNRDINQVTAAVGYKILKEIWSLM
ncbi:MAG: agmatinase [Saprospiraceae bacterium]|nr:agmatinase [Saprospiraceae bacterium]